MTLKRGKTFVIEPEKIGQTSKPRVKQDVNICILTLNTIHRSKTIRVKENVHQWNHSGVQIT